MRVRLPVLYLVCVVTAVPETRVLPESSNQTEMMSEGKPVGHGFTGPAGKEPLEKRASEMRLTSGVGRKEGCCYACCHFNSPSVFRIFSSTLLVKNWLIVKMGQGHRLASGRLSKQAQSCSLQPLPKGGSRFWLGLNLSIFFPLFWHLFSNFFFYLKIIIKLYNISIPFHPSESFLALFQVYGLLFH